MRTNELGERDHAKVLKNLNHPPPNLAPTVPAFVSSWDSGIRGTYG